jgi:hypothetical protein
MHGGADADADADLLWEKTGEEIGEKCDKSGGILWEVWGNPVKILWNPVEDPVEDPVGKCEVIRGSADAESAWMPSQGGAALPFVAVREGPAPEIFSDPSIVYMDVTRRATAPNFHALYDATTAFPHLNYEDQGVFWNKVCPWETRVHNRLVSSRTDGRLTMYW